MTYIDNNICELTQVHRGKVVWNTIVPLAWTFGLDTVAWVRVHLSLVGHCSLGYRAPLSLGQCVLLGWTVGWDTVAWVRMSRLAGLLQPGLERTP